MLSLSSRLTSCDRRTAEILANHVSAKRQRQPGLILPPHAEIGDEVQPLILERELSFVDDEPRVVLPGRDRVDDLVERDDLVDEPIRRMHRFKEQLQSQERRRERAGHGDLDTGQVA